MTTSKCKSCHADIVWLITKNGKAMPVNADTVIEGDRQFDKERGHVSHYATCPDADQHRKSRNLPSANEPT